MARETIVVIVP